MWQLLAVPAIFIIIGVSSGLARAMDERDRRASEEDSA